MKAKGYFQLKNQMLQFKMKKEIIIKSFQMTYFVVQ